METYLFYTAAPHGGLAYETSIDAPDFRGATERFETDNQELLSTTEFVVVLEDTARSAASHPVAWLVTPRQQPTWRLGLEGER